MIYAFVFIADIIYIQREYAVMAAKMSIYSLPQRKHSVMQKPTFF